jgi:hypothetical protein
MALEQELAPFKPIPKFLCIKAIIFFSFWQEVLIAFLVWVGAISGNDNWTVTDLSTYIQDSLICYEMFLISFCLVYAFGYYQYFNPESGSLVSDLRSNPIGGVIKPLVSNVSTVLSPKDVVNDTFDVFGRQLLKKDDDINELPYGQFVASSSSSSKK